MADNVLPFKCMVPECKAKPDKLAFCAEHYSQFKFGLIKKDGKRASDFEKKLEHFKDHHKKVA